MAEHQAFISSPFPIWLLLAVFGTCIALAVLHGARLLMLWRKRRWPALCDRLGTLAAVFVASVLSADIIDATTVRHGSSQHLLLSVLSVAAAVAVSVLHLKLVSTGPSGRAFSHVIANGLLLMGWGAAALWSGQRFYAVSQPFSDFGLPPDTPGRLLESDHWVAVTERGREVPLFHWEVAHDSFEYYASLEPVRYGSLWSAVIQRAPPDERTNCHGWVFTSGRHLLRGLGVQAILDDNRYQMTDRPQPGDLVIYSDAAGQITHTGLVRGVLDEGTVIVESKWGIDGRFLHCPEDQPYSPTFRYYHRPGAGHQITIRAKQPVHAPSLLGAG